MSSSIEKYGRRAVDEGKHFLKSLDIDEDVDLSSKGTIQNVLSKGNYGLYISDFQGVTEKLLSSLKEDTTVKRMLFHLGDISDHQNLFIDSLYVLFDSKNLSQQIILQPKISGKNNEGTAIFRLIHNQRQLSSVAIDFSELGNVMFDIPLDLTGEFSVELEGDDVYYDNEFFFYLGQRVRPKVALISNDSEFHIKEVFGNNEVFDLQILDSKSIDYQIVEQSDVVILKSLTNLPSGFVTQLNKKTVLIFPRATTNLISSLNGISNSFLQEESSYSSLQIDYNHPLFSGVFAKKNEQTEMPYGTPIFQMTGDYEALISFRDKTPYLIKLKDSNTFLFNSSLSLDSSNMVSHAIFLPLMYQLAFSSREYNQHVFSHPSDVLSLRVENQEYPPKFVSEGLEFVPEFNPSRNGLSIKIPTLEPGFYDLVHERDTFVLAINSPKEESIMKGIAKSELEAYFKDSEHIRILNDDANEGSIVLESSIWKYALILMLLLIMTETALHRFLQ